MSKRIAPLAQTSIASTTTVAEIAAELGVDHKTVRRALIAAGFDMTNERHDRAEAIETVRNIADPARMIGHASHGRGAPSNTATIIADARARSEIAKAARTELDLEVRRGDLVERVAVLEAGADLIARVRTTLLSIGFRIAPKVEGLSVDQAARIINEELRIALGVLGDSDAFTAEVLS